MPGLYKLARKFWRLLSRSLLTNLAQ